MAFDMTKCKIGDKLKTMDGSAVEHTSYDRSNSPYCWWIGDKISVDKFGYKYDASNISNQDIVGFWEGDIVALPPTITITHNLTIKGHTHVLTTEEVAEVLNGLIDSLIVLEDGHQG